MQTSLKQISRPLDERSGMEKIEEFRRGFVLMLFTAQRINSESFSRAGEAFESYLCDNSKLNSKVCLRVYDSRRGK